MKVLPGKGVEGIKNVYSSILDVLKKGDDYYAIQVDPELFKKDFIKFIQFYHKQRIRAGIKVKLLSNETTRKEVIKCMSIVSKGMEIKFTSRPIPAATLIFGDKVATFVWSNDPVCIVIQSKQIALRYKKFFEYLWNTAKK